MKNSLTALAGSGSEQPQTRKGGKVTVDLIIDVINIVSLIVQFFIDLHS